MSEQNGNGSVNGTSEMHVALKAALAEMLPDMLRASQAPIAQVPAPPVAAVHRPSAWRPTEPTPSAPTAAPSNGGAVEHVRLQSDQDLDAFVRSLARRLEQPSERSAILTGKLRFSLSASTAASAPPTGGAQHIERGAVTERVIERAAAEGSVLVLGPKAVLTPMGRDRARALGVKIQRETAC